MVALSQAATIGAPPIELGTVDSTTHDSTGGWGEVLPTVKRGGSFPVTFLYDPDDSGHAAMVTNHGAKTLTAFEIVIPTANSAEVGFSAYITGLDIEPGDVEGRLEMQMTLTPSGAITVTASP